MLTRLFRSFWPCDGIFVDDVGEVAFLEAMTLFPVAVDHPGCELRSSRPPPCPAPRPFAGGANLQRLVDGGAQHQPERAE